MMQGAKTSTTAMANDDLDLQIGDQFQIQFLQDDGRRVRPTVRVIGMLIPASILVTAPSQNGKVMLVREGQVFVVRCFSRDMALAFTSRVLRVCTHPYPYIHLAYPEQREEVQVRSARRVTVLLAATVHREREGNTWSIPIPSVVSDLSTNGSMLETTETLGTIGSKLKILFHLPIDGMNEQPVALIGVIRTVYEDTVTGDRYRYGIEFMPADDGAKLKLRAYVYEQLLGNER
jgi:c-di-GMP-binding flagellar brake protein YcgR